MCRRSCIFHMDCTFSLNMMFARCSYILILYCKWLMKFGSVAY